MKKLYSLLLITLACLSALLNAETSNQNFELVQKIYAAYDSTNNTLGKLPDTKEICIENLKTRKEIITTSLANVSYKNVLFSPALLLMTASALGSIYTHFNQLVKIDETLQDIPMRVIIFLQSNAGHEEIKKSFRYLQNQPHDGYITYEQATVHAKDKLQNMMEEKVSESGLFSGGLLYPFNTQITVGALATLSALAGFGFYADIQAMKTKKAQLNAELETIRQLLLLLEKNQ